MSSFSCSSSTSQSISSSSSSSSHQNASPQPSVISAALEQITQLSNPQQEIVSFTTDPKVFFASFGINTCLFTEQDVHLLHSLFRKTKFNPNVCLMDLLGLRFYHLLKQLTSSWPEKIQKEYQKKWAAFYLMGYLGVLRYSVEGLIPISDGTEKFHCSPARYMRETREFMGFLILMQNTQIQQCKKTPKALQLLKTQTKALQEEWQGLQTFLEKCLVQKEPWKILSDHTLISCSGIEWMMPTSESEVLEAIKNLRLYLEMSVTAEEASLEKGWSCVKDSCLKNVLAQVDSLIRLKKPKEIIIQSKIVLDSVSKVILNIKENIKLAEQDLEDARQGMSQIEWCQKRSIQQKTTKTPNQFVESLIQTKNLLVLKSCWLSDCQKILEESIVNPLDPSFYISSAYADRARVNLEAIVKDLSSVFKTNFLIVGLPEHQTIEGRLCNIKLNFFISLQKEGIFLKIDYLYRSLSDTYGNLFLKDRNINFLLASLEKLVYATLEELCALDYQNYEKQSLSQQLLWLCRIFVWLHDLKVLSKPVGECSELEIFPDKLLQLLVSDTSPKASPLQSGLDVETFPELSILQPLEISLPSSNSLEGELPKVSLAEEMLLEASPIHLEDAAIKSVRQTQKIEDLPQADSRTLKKKEKKQSSPPLPGSKLSPKEPIQKNHSTVHPDGVTPRDLMQIRKRRDVEAILTSLGLKPIRTKGDHTIWENPNDARIHTVVPRHAEIKKGTLSAIVKQITPQD